MFDFKYFTPTKVLFGKNTGYSEIIPAIRELDFSYLKEERV